MIATIRSRRYTGLGPGPGFRGKAGPGRTRRPVGPPDRRLRAKKGSEWILTVVVRHQSRSNAGPRSRVTALRQPS
ncbi:MAG: hypothetical protein MZV70_22465 [Desulfobacterales bacterium]|nr:hypothetical protein [Desulfobacterales bacterium]